MEKLNKLEEGKYYTISFDPVDIYQVYNSNKIPKIIEIKVLIKLEKSIKLFLVEEEKIQWYPTSSNCQIFDEIPAKYKRKEKLQRLNEDSLET